MVLVLGVYMHACTLLVWHALYLFLSPNIDIVILILMQCPQAGFIERCAVAGIRLINHIFLYFCFPLLISLIRLLKTYPVDVKTCLPI